MSLPAGIINRPAMVAPHPVAVGKVFHGAFKIGVLLLPLLLSVAAQVPGLALRRSSAQIESEIASQALLRRQLLAEREALLSPDRLRHEAERLGLVAPAPNQRPVVIPAAFAGRAR